MFCQNLADGYIWSHPPNYWENVVWPAYLKAHKDLFAEGAVNRDAVRINSDSGSPTPNSMATATARRPVAGLIVLPAEDETLERLIEISCIELKAFQTTLIEGATDWRFVWRKALYRFMHIHEVNRESKDMRNTETDNEIAVSYFFFFAFFFFPPPPPPAPGGIIGSSSISGTGPWGVSIPASIIWLWEGRGWLADRAVPWGATSIILNLELPGGRFVTPERAVPVICMILDLVLPGGIWFWWNVGSGIRCALPVLTGEVLARYAAVWLAALPPTENASPPLLNGPKGAKLCPESRT
jgi:hypothetical protein